MGALIAGVVADLFGLAAAIWAVAVVTALSGAVVAARMYETHRPGAGTFAAVPPPTARVTAAPPAGVRRW